MKKNKTAFNKIYSTMAVLLIVILLSILFLKFLSDGIKINNISIAGIKISGLYLKLNNKLILTINNVNIEKSKQKDAQPSLITITNTIKQTISISSLFEKLDIQNINYNNEKSSIYFDGDNYNIDMPYIIASFSLQKSDKDILINIDTLKVKSEDIVLDGKVLYLDKENTFAFDIKSYINNKNSIINYQGQTNLKHLYIVVDSTNIKSIDIAAKYIKLLNEEVYEWIYKKIKFENLLIKNAYLEVNNIEAKDVYKRITNNIYVNAEVTNVELKIDDNLEAITSKKVAIIFNKGKLYFTPNKALYGGLNVDRGEVVISNFFDKQTLLTIFIESKKAILNNNILNILKVYDINLPILQKDGITNGFIKFEILLPTDNIDMSIKQTGKLDVTNSNINISGFDLFVKSANIVLDNNNVFLNNAGIKIDDIADAIINATIDIEKQNINITTDFNKLNIKSDDMELVNLNNKSIQSTLNFGDKISFSIPEYNINIDYNENINIYINDLNKIVSLSPILNDIDINNGSLYLKTKDFKNIKLNGELNNLNYPIYNIDNTKLDSIKIIGDITPNFISISNDNDNINMDINLNTNEIELKGKNIIVDINEYLESKIPILNKDNKNGTSKINIKIDINNTLIKLFGYIISMEKAFLTTTKDGFIANGINKNGIAKINYTNGNMNVEANNFNSDFVNTFFNKKVVSGGSFGLQGRFRDGNFICNITMLTTSVRNMTGLQNILSLIDTIPSLVAFKLPGFSANGYEIENANITMGINKELIAINNIDIKGSSVDVMGNGIVDLNTKDLNIELELSTIKSLSSILNKIPIIGYLILGESGKISTKLKVQGTIDEPKTDISLLKDTINAPVNILKRIFKPFEVLSNELKNESKKKEKSINNK